MEPRLVIISGVNRGKIVRLSDSELTIGRDAGSGICLLEEAVSREHCVIQAAGSSHRIVDNKSLNGTFVNEIPVRERILRHGDTIRLGASELLFLLEDDDSPDQPLRPKENSQESIAGDQTATLSVPDRPFMFDQGQSDIGKMARDLNALMKISTRINTIHKVELLQREFLEIVFEVIPAKRGSVILTSRGEEEASVWERDGSKGSFKAIDWKIVNRALWERSSMVNEPAVAFPGQENAGHVLCVPLTASHSAIGVIYLISAPGEKFDEIHVQFVTVVAGILAVALENAIHRELLEGENLRLRGEIELEHALIGESSAMNVVLDFISRAAPTASTVLIRGESGTGKELVARAIHRNSPRKNNPFVAINCAAITETLLESEMFGHERGAFTGATALKKGRLEVANTGTLFLDEIGELTPALQAKLLRVLQNREFERIGSTHAIKVDVRFVAATNRNLEEAMKCGAFRPDLFYRLNVVSIALPPLREHREDIPLLAMYFASEYSKKCNRLLKGISREARELLMNYTWPGNVRELENAIERAVVLGLTDVIVPEDLPEAVLEGQALANSSSKYHESLDTLKKQLIMDAIDSSGGTITEAAKLLGVHPNYLHRLIRNLKLRPVMSRDSAKAKRPA